MADQSSPGYEHALRRWYAMAMETCVIVPTAGSVRSQLGGVPSRGIAGDWPVWKGASQQFLAEIDLAELREAGGPDWLPPEGALLFFYDANQETWGFDPKDVGSWTVRYRPADARHTTIAVPSDLAPHPDRPITFCLEVSLPGPERIDGLRSGLAKSEIDRLFERYDAMAMGTRHRIGGFPEAVQNDSMEEECQLASNGIYVGNSDGYRSAEAKALRPGASDWRLLLQLDTDDALDMMWGDMGRLYFWIREADARAGRFERSWMVLQCC